MTDNNGGRSHSPDSVEQAMNTVLEAERAAEQAIANCNSEAQLVIQAAQEQAQHIVERTDARLTLCNMRCSTKVSQEIKARLRAEHAELQGQSGQELDAVALTAVVETVARELISSSRDEGGDGGATG